MKYLAILLGLFSATLYAEARIHASSCRVADGQVLVDIDASLHLDEAPITALKSGLNLYMVYDFRLQANRRWWGHALAPYAQRLGYNPISQQFILENPATLKRLSFASVTDALANIAHIRALPVLPASALRSHESYQLNMRLRLDEAQLPVALRLEVLRNPDWHIESDWFTCPLDR